MKRACFLFIIILLIFPFVKGQAQVSNKTIPGKTRTVGYGHQRTMKKTDSVAARNKMKELEDADKASLLPKTDTIKAPTKTAPGAVVRKSRNGEGKETTEMKLPEGMPKPESKRGDRIDRWSLQRCVLYARENNLQVQSAELNERLATLQWQQTRSSRIPTLNADASAGDSYGRSIDPTSNQYVTKGFLYNSLSLSSQVLLFGWFQKKYQTQQNHLDLLATVESYSQLKDDISLNVVTGFLRLLLAREQLKVSEAQIILDLQQYEQTQTFARAGKIPEINVSQMFAQLANDSAVWMNNRSEEQLSMLQLRALMNFDFETPFEIVEPEINIRDLSAITQLTDPATICEIAMKNQHRMRYDKLKLESAKKSLEVTKTLRYPQLSVFANMGTNYSSNLKNIIGQTQTGSAPIGSVEVGDSSFVVSVPTYKYVTQNKPILKQYGDNIRANAGLSLTIPILNNATVRSNIERALIGIQTQELILEQDQLKLKQDIYTAYQQAQTAVQKFDATKHSQDAAARALDFAVKRYAVGMISPFEYTQVKNTYNSACSAVVSAKYDLIFKVKVLDYYTGNPLKL